MSGTPTTRPRQVIFFLFVFLFATLFIQPGRPGAEPESGPVSPPANSARAAILLPLSGPFETLGRKLRRGFELGFDFAATHGGGEPAVSYLDTESDPETARTLVALLASEGQALIAAGTPLNPCAWTASQAAEKNGLPYLVVGADQDNLVTPASAFTFRVTPPRAAFRQMLTNFIKSRRPRVRSLGIIRGENPCARRNARRQRDLCLKLGLDLAIWNTYQKNESNFYDLLNLVRDRKPGLLLLVAGPAANRKLWLQGQRLGIFPKYTIALPDNCLAPAPQAADQQEEAGLLRPAGPAPAGRTDYPALPDHNQAAAFATAQLIASLLAKPSIQTPAAAAAALEKTSLKTISGTIVFTGPGTGHQNRAAWRLVTTTAEGVTQVIFPGSGN